MDRSDAVKRTERVKADAYAVCHECGAEPATNDPFRWARKHAEKTGHVPSVIVTYDIHKA